MQIMPKFAENLYEKLLNEGSIFIPREERKEEIPIKEKIKKNGCSEGNVIIQKSKC